MNGEARHLAAERLDDGQRLRAPAGAGEGQRLLQPDLDEHLPHVRAALLAREEAAGQERLRLVRAAVLGEGEGEPLEQLAAASARDPG